MPPASTICRAYSDANLLAMCLKNYLDESVQACGPSALAAAVARERLAVQTRLSSRLTSCGLRVTGSAAAERPDYGSCRAVV